MTNTIFGRWELAVADDRDVYIRNGIGINIGVQTFNVRRLTLIGMCMLETCIKCNSNMMSFFRVENKRAIYRLDIISFAHAPVHVTDFPAVNVYVDELWSARIWQHKLCATLSANVIMKKTSTNQSILPYLYSQIYWNHNNSWRPECVLSFNMRIKY